VFVLYGGLAAGLSLVQGVLPFLKNDYRTEKEAWALNGPEESLRKKSSIRHAGYFA
jgi:hypothetical protein